MRNIFLILLMTTLFPFAGICQSETLSTDKGDITMTPIFHSALVLEWNDRVVFVDPYGGAERYADFPSPELVIITHAHGDHMNRETLEGLDLTQTELIAPESVVSELTDIEFKKVSTVGIFGGASRTGIRIEGFPMYNIPDDETARHRRGWGNGYLIHIGGKKIYISGDTEDIIEMRALQDVDYAFVCMNQPYTMTVEKAADAVLEFRPKVVYPFHYRGKDGFSDVEQFKTLVSEDPEIEVRLLNWYPE